VTIVATVAGTIRVDVNALTQDERRAAWQGVSCVNPEWVRNQRSKAPNAARILARTPQRISAMRIEGGEILYPRAAANILARIVGPGRIRWVDRRVSAPLASPLVLRAQLRAYQRRVVEALRQGSGTAQGPTGMGKTLTALALIVALCQRAMVIVHTRDLVTQWRTVILRELGVEPAMIVGGTVPPEVATAPITVAMIQSLTPERLALIAPLFGQVTIDESHHAAADTYVAALSALPARWRHGFSATAERPDGLHVLTGWHIGPQRARVTIAEVTAAQFIEAPRYVQIATAWTTTIDASERYSDAITAMSTDPERNALIVDTIARDHKASPGLVSLVLCARVAHVDALAGMLAARGLRAVGITGAASASARTAALEATRKGDVDVLIATSLADEGLDVPALQNLYLAGNSRAEGKLLQRVGRVLRPHPGKGAPLVVDFVDERVGVFAHQGRVRRDTFVRHFGRGAVAA
jgi:superfamily II DNA or RNA helicase